MYLGGLAGARSGRPAIAYAKRILQAEDGRTHSIEAQGGRLGTECATSRRRYLGQERGSQLIHVHELSLSLSFNAPFRSKTFFLLSLHATLPTSF